MKALQFTVDSKLLSELGEKLVGKPFIALGELIKNSYDADSEFVKIEFYKIKNGMITIEDNGQGMNYEEFKNFWMRIGSTHKEEWEKSPKFKRSLTGKKGIGRLAAQFLAKEMELYTVSEKDTKKRLKAWVNWQEAIDTGDLIKAKVSYDIEKGNFNKGTVLKLIDLNQNWEEDNFKYLAQEIWNLSPPFPAFKPEKGSFKVELLSYDKKIEEKFKSQIKAHLKNYDARIYGENKNGNVKTYLEFWNEKPIKIEYKLRRKANGKHLKYGKFEIRIFKLLGRQRYGILVQDLRDYMHKFGGIHIYDSNFRLPYYGSKDSDWLGILQEHARRIGVSDILPKELQIDDGLTRLPSLSRMLGAIQINTSKEPGLDISITRDRLIETDAYLELVYMIRYALHLYAMEDMKKVIKYKHLEMDILSIPIKEYYEVGNILEKHKSEISEDIYPILKDEIDYAIETVEKQDKKRKEQISLLGAFATAGISSIIYHHEMRRQIFTIETIVEDIEELSKENKEITDELKEIKDDLKSWLEKAKGIQLMFTNYADVDNYQVNKRLNARNVIADIKKHLQKMAKDVNIDFEDIPPDLLLPKASLIEWSAIFQNVLTNAFNAMSSFNKKNIKIIFKCDNNVNKIIIQDTGSGVDLKNSEKLFQPFVRITKISQEKKDSGYGGTGIGLTIVKFISEKIGCNVAFVKPNKNFNTAFSLSWSEKNE